MLVRLATMEGAMGVAGSVSGIGVKDDDIFMDIATRVAESISATCDAGGLGLERLAWEREYE